MKKLFLTPIVIISVFSISHAQIIRTVAGNGVVGYSGNGGPATDAELTTPNGMSIDAAGNVYSANTTSNCITKISTTGIITFVAGIGGTAGYSGDGGPATAAELDGPNDVTVDKNGNLYIAERYNNDVRMVNTSGIISTIAGNGSSTWSGDGGQATAAGMNDPAGVAEDNKGNIYIAEYGSDVVRKINSSGIISTIAGQANNPGFSGDGMAATSAQLNDDVDVAVDTLGNLYISDANNDRIRIVNTSGIISTFAGNGIASYSGDGGPATAAEVNWPDYLFIDKDQNIYFGDWNNDRARKINTGGIITTIGGNGVQGFSGDGGPATSAELYHPAGVVLSNSGNFYFDDEFNNRVREVVLNTEGIDNIATLDGITIFPNPANQTLSIKFDNGVNSGILLINDVTGKNVLSQKIDNKQSTLQVNVSAFANGIYFVTIENEGKKYTSKFIKE